MKEIIPEETDQSIIDQRIKNIYTQTISAASKMGMPANVTKRIELYCQLDSLQISPQVKYNKKTRKIELYIPFLFLFKQSDITEMNELGKLFKKTFCSTILTQNEFKLSSALFEFLSDSEAAENAKSFVLHHELAHIFHGDILVLPASDEDSRKREKRADFTAALYSGQSAAAIRCFQIVGSHIPLP